MLEGRRNWGGRSMRLVLAFGCALLSAVTMAQAAPAESYVSCSQISPPKQLTSYENAKATLISLWYARNAAQRGSEFDQERKKENYDAIQLITAMMRMSKIAQ